MRQFAPAESQQILVRRIPQPVAFEAEVFKPEAGEFLVRHHFRRPRTEILDASDFDARLVDIDPVVREEVGFVDDQRHGDEIAIAQLVGGCRARRFRGERMYEFADRRRRNDVTRRERHRLARFFTRRDRPQPLLVVVAECRETRSHVDFATLRTRFARRGVPHHARTLARVLEALDQRLDDFAVVGRRAIVEALRLHRVAQRVRHGRPEVEALDALRRPVGRNFIAAHPPHFLGVGLEENCEQPLAELVGDPVVERLRLLVREGLLVHERQDAHRAFDDAEIAESFERF